MAKNLVIVESPAKAKTINKYLGRNYLVRASMGHVRDLPKSTLGVSINGDVEVKYLVSKEKKELVKELVAELKKADVLWLATDLDREGEAIAWHLAEALKAKPEQIRRVTFSEITKDAIAEAFASPRELMMDLVDAQQSRRVIDRLVGYKLSPVLWDNVEGGRSLSAGRVQSVATRLVVDREREIEAFESEEYFSIRARLALGSTETGNATGNGNGSGTQSFEARLLRAEGAELNFTSQPRLVLTPEADGKKAKPTVAYTGAVAEAGTAARYVADLERATYRVGEVRTSEVKRRPTAPFTTSTLQQEAARKLGFAARRTMGLAQRLYEGVELPGEGQVALITYMRTDSVNLSELALAEAQATIVEDFGERYSDGPRTYKSRSKNAQEAHEAIRPTSIARRPDAVEAALGDGNEGRDLARLYRLIWRRTVASQMTDAVLSKVSADIEATVDGVAEPYVLRATGQTVVFDGFLRVYSEDVDESEAPDAEADADTDERRLPELHDGDALDAVSIESRDHATKPPPRYTEASLVKKLEELGIGRPSTYAPTLATITEREYVIREDKRFEASELGMQVNDFLVEHFPEYVDYAFTARMEEDLDDIAGGGREWKPEVRHFADELERRIDKVMGGCPSCGAALEFRTGFRGRRYIACTACDFQRPLGARDGNYAPEPLGETCPQCGEHELVKKRGRFGWFIACTGYPGCTYSRPSDEEAEEANAPTGVVCDKCGKDMVMKRGRFGPFLGCSGYPECSNIKRIEESTGVACPKCHEGELNVRRTKRRKTFYGCNRYPDCDFVVWERPYPVPCPDCGGLLTGAADTLTCTECKHKFAREDLPLPEPADGAAESDAVPAAVGSASSDGADEPPALPTE